MQTEVRPKGNLNAADIRVKRRVRFNWIDAFRFVLLAISAIAMLFPLLWMVTIALKSNNDVFKIPPEWFPREFHWSNFVTGTKEINFWQTFGNSLLIAITCTIGQIISSVLVGYGLARLKFPG